MSALYELATLGHLEHGSRVAQWKRAGPITQRSVDRNHALLTVLLQKNFEMFLFLYIKLMIFIVNARRLINCFIASALLQ